MSIIKVENLKKVYTTYERGNSFHETVASLFRRKMIHIEALKGISFNINEGELVGFLGPNGAGKSTTLKILTGVLFPTSGSCDVMGYTPWRDRKKYVAHIGAVFGQKSQLLWDIPPVDAFYMNKAIYNIPTAEFQKRLNNIVELLDVGDVIKKPTRQLSLGQRMKCEFIMAMLHHPGIVFLDEPTIGLDVVAKDRIREFILEMNKSGTTFILTTHDLEDVERLARRVVVINTGEVVFDDALEALRNYSGSKKIATISTCKPLTPMSMEGITVLQSISPFDASFELDMDVIELNRFIEVINARFIIRDMSIEEQPIESVVKELYKNRTNS